MIAIPNDSSPLATIIGIDPGTENLGLCVMAFNVLTNEITSTWAKTFVGSKLPGGSHWVETLFSARESRIIAHRINLVHLFNHEQPVFVACESPFFNRLRPQAYGALTEIVCAIRGALQEYDIWTGLVLIDPPSVKNAVGAPGNAGKELVRDKVLSLTHLNYTGDTPIEELDEHSIDAIAVAYCQFKKLME